MTHFLSMDIALPHMVLREKPSTVLVDFFHLSAPYGPAGRHSLWYDPPDSSGGSERTNQGRTPTRTARHVFQRPFFPDRYD